MGKFRQFLTELSVNHMSVVSFPDNKLSKINRFSPNLVCALILMRSSLGLLMVKFRQLLIELSSHHTTVAGYNRLKFQFTAG